MVAMDKDTSKLYLQNLEEFILDEAKLVTYKWLSRELNLHVNLSKELLQTFLKQQKKIVHATYLLSGLLKDEVTHKVLIVQEEDLDTAKLQFKILSSEHVYSIQKFPKVADLNSLYIIDRYKKDNFKSLCNTMSALHCNEAVERAADEIAKLRIEVKACAASTDIRAWQGSKKTTEDDKIGAAASNSGLERVAKKEDKKEFGIAAMFAAQGMRSLKQENTSEKSKSNVKLPTSSKNCIVMFLNRNIEKPEEKSEAEISVVSKEKGTQEQLLGDESTSVQTEVSIKGRVKSEQGYKKKKVSNVEDSTGKGKRKAPDDLPSKKRKRILRLSDSEDSDDGIFGSEDEETQNPPLLDPEPASLPLIETDEEVVAPTPQGETKPGRKRERKLKVSTFMDEDGYVVTKREFVVESCTDSEGEEEEKKKKKMKTEQNYSEKVDDEANSPPSEPPAKKKCSPQKVKQATLTDFFKKK